MLNAYPQVDPQKIYVRKPPNPGYTIQLLSRLLTILNVLCVALPCFLDAAAVTAPLIQFMQLRNNVHPAWVWFSHAFLAAVRSRGAYARTWCILRSHEIVYAYAWGRAKRN